MFISFLKKKENLLEICTDIQGEQNRMKEIWIAAIDWKKI